MLKENAKTLMNVKSLATVSAEMVTAKINEAHSNAIVTKVSLFPMTRETASILMNVNTNHVVMANALTPMVVTFVNATLDMNSMMVPVLISTNAVKCMTFVKMVSVIMSQKVHLHVHVHTVMSALLTVPTASTLVKVLVISILTLVPPKTHSQCPSQNHIAAVNVMKNPAGCSMVHVTLVQWRALKSLLNCVQRDVVIHRLQTDTHVTLMNAHLLKIVASMENA